MAKQYDKIIKENIEQIFLPLAEKYLGIKIIKSEQLPEKIHITEEREPDFTKIVVTDTGETFILHMEFQTTDDKEMVYRIAEYKAMKMRKFKMAVKSFVIYLGQSTPQMRTSLKDDEIIKDFKLLNLHELNPEQIINSQIPEEVILAILGDYPRNSAELIIIQILERLREICGNKTLLNKYVKQLTVLSRLRNLELETKNQVEHMPITYDITKDGLYLEGIKVGEKRGEKRGERRGEKRVEKRLISTAKNLLIRGMSVQEVSDITSLSVEQVNNLVKKLPKNKK